MKKQLVTLGAGILFLLPLYGYAEEVATPVLGNASSTKEQKDESASSTPLLKTFTTCSQEAIEARDTSIASSRLTYNNAMTSALLERKNSEKAAVALKTDDAKKDALKLSVETYKKEAKAAQTTLTQARKLTWQTFDNDIKKCRELEDTDTASKSEDDQPTVTSEPATFSRKMEKSENKEEVKTIKDTIKAQFESFKSLFN